MDTELLKKKPCAWATARADGGLFWENGIFEGDDEQHYFFRIGDKLRVYLKTEIKRLEFKTGDV